MTKKEQIEIKYLEDLASVFWNVLLKMDILDGHHKNYDPLTIEKVKGGYMLHSYIFDYEDGGRHRFKKTLKEARTWLMDSFIQNLNQNE